MNAWNSLKTFARTLAFACVCLAFVPGLGRISLHAQNVNPWGDGLPLPEYITHPVPRLVPNTKNIEIALHFACRTSEPSAVDTPVVQWYCDGNFIAEQKATVFNKQVGTFGDVTYEYWDPYTLPKGTRAQAGVGSFTSKGRIVWEAIYAIPAGSPTGLYRAYIPDLKSFTNYFEVLETPATPPGGTRPALQVVKSPVDIFREEKSSVSIWGDAKGHGVSLFNYPYGVTVDAEGFTYIADTENHAIRRATPGGYVETVAGIDGEPGPIYGQDLIFGTLTGGTSNSMTDRVVTFDSNRGISAGQIIVPSGGVITSGSAFVVGGTYKVESVLPDKRSIMLTQPLGRIATGFTALLKPDARGPRTQYFYSRNPLYGPATNLELAGAVITPNDTLVSVAGTLSLTKGAAIVGYGVPDGTTVADFSYNTLVLSGPADKTLSNATLFFGAGPSIPLSGSTLSSTATVVVSNTVSATAPFPAAAQLKPGMYVTSTETGNVGIASPSSVVSVGTSTLVLSGVANGGNALTTAGTAVSVAASAGSQSVSGVRLTAGGTIATIIYPSLPTGWNPGMFLEGNGIPNNTKIIDRSRGTISMSGTATVTSKSLVTGGTVLLTANMAPPVATLTGGTHVASSNVIRVGTVTGIYPGMFVEAGSPSAFPPATRVLSTTPPGAILTTAAALTSGTNTISVYSVGGTLSAETTAGSNVAAVVMTDALAALPSTTRLYGTGIPAGTTLQSVSTSVVMSGTATQSFVGSGTLVTAYPVVKDGLIGLTLWSGTVGQTATVSGLSATDIANLSPGMRVYNSGIPNGTTIAAIQTNVLLDNPATATGVLNLAAIQPGPAKTAQVTAGFNQVRLKEGTSGLTPGMAVIGPGMPSGATIGSMPLSVILSKPILATAVAGGTTLSSPSAGKWSQQYVPSIVRSATSGNVVTGNSNFQSYRYGDVLSNEQIKASKQEPLFDSPEGVSAADDLSVYVADTGNNAIRRIYRDGAGHTVVDTLPLEYTRNDLVGKKQITLNQPRGIAFFGSLSYPDVTNPPALYVLDFVGLWRFALDSTGSTIKDSTLIRNLNVGWLSGVQTQPGDQASFRNYAPRGVAVTDLGRTVYIADTVNHVIRKISLNSDYSYQQEDIVAGFLGAKGSVDGKTGFYPLKATDRYVAQDNVSRIAYPAGLAMDANQNLYFTEMGFHKIRRVVFDSTDATVSARVETLAGSGLPGPLDGSKGEGAGAGASFWYPAAIALDNSDPLNPSFAVADSSNHAIRRITLTSSSAVTGGTVTGGTVTTVTGGTAATVTGGTSTSAVTATSVNQVGVVGCAGNRDFAELAEYNSEWKWYGQPIADEWAFAGRAITPTWYRLNLTDLRVDDSGPIELDITNLYGAIGITAQSQLRVTPKAPDDLPKFWQPGYKQRITRSDTGIEVSQLRNEAGDLDITQWAMVAPSDQVTYQWEVFNSQSLSGGTVTAETKTDPLKLYVSDISGIKVGDSLVQPGPWMAGISTIRPGTRVLAITPGTLNSGTLAISKNALTGKSGVVIENWIPLRDSLTDTRQDSRLSSLIGVVGSNTFGNLTSITGAQTSTLTIRRFQKALTGVLPQVRFRNLSLSKTVIARQRDLKDYTSPVEKHDEVVTDDISWTFYPGIPALPASFATVSAGSLVTTTMDLGLAATTMVDMSGVNASITPPAATSAQMDAKGNSRYLMFDSMDWLAGLTGPSPGTRTIYGDYLALAGTAGTTVGAISNAMVSLGSWAAGNTYPMMGAFKTFGSTLTSVNGQVEMSTGSLRVTAGQLESSGGAFHADVQALGSNFQIAGGTYVTQGGTYTATGGGFTASGGAFVFKAGTLTSIGGSLESFDQTVNILGGTVSVIGGAYTQVFQPVIGGTTQVIVGGTYTPVSQGAIFQGTVSLAAAGSTLSGGTYYYGTEVGVTTGTVATTGGEIGIWGGTLTVDGTFAFSSKDGQLSALGGTLTSQGGGYSYTDSTRTANPDRVSLYRGNLSLAGGTVSLNGAFKSAVQVTTNGTLAAVSLTGGAALMGGTVTTTGGTLTTVGATVTFAGGTPAAPILNGTVTSTNGAVSIYGGTLTYSDGKYTNVGGSLVASGSSVGFAGANNWMQTSGGSLTIVGARFSTFGGAVNNGGTLTVSGGIITSSGGVVTSTGGTVRIGGPLFVGTVTTLGTNLAALAGGTLSTTSNTITAEVGVGASGAVVFTNGTVSLSGGTVSSSGGAVLASLITGAGTSNISIAGGVTSVSGDSLAATGQTLTTSGGTLTFGGPLLAGTVTTAIGGTVAFTGGTLTYNGGKMDIAAVSQGIISGSVWDTHYLTGGMKQSAGGDLAAIGGTLIMTGGGYVMTESRVTTKGGLLTLDAAGTITTSGGTLGGYTGTIAIDGGSFQSVNNPVITANLTTTGASLKASTSPTSGGTITILSGLAKVTGGTFNTTGGTVATTTTVSVGAAQTSQGQWQAPKVVQSSFAPVFSPNARPAPTSDLTRQSLLFERQADGSAKAITLTLSGSLWAFPKLAGDDSLNPNVRLWHQWMFESENGVVTPASAVLVGSTFAYTIDSFNYDAMLAAARAGQASKAGNYFIRAWVGELNAYADPNGNDAKRLGGKGYFVDSQKIHVAFPMPPEIRNFVLNRTTPSFQVVNLIAPYDQTVDLTVNFDARGNLTDESIIQQWQYLPWADAFVGGELRSDLDAKWNEIATTIYTYKAADALVPQSILGGSFVFSASVSQGRLQITQFPRLTQKDPSGLYRLKVSLPATIYGPAKEALSPVMVVGVRDTPYALQSIDAYAIETGVVSWEKGVASFVGATKTYAYSKEDLDLNALPPSQLRLSAQIVQSAPDLYRARLDTGVAIRFIWRHDGERIYGDNVYIPSGPTLAISAFKNDETGYYTLSATNAASAKEINLSPVQSEVDKIYGWKLGAPGGFYILSEPTARTITSGQASVADGFQRVAVGQQAVLEMPVTTNPAPDVKWSKWTDGKWVYKGSSTTGPYMIKSVSLLDAGSYQVLISSGTQSVERRLQLFVEPIPDPATPAPSTNYFTLGNSITLSAKRTSTGALFSASKETKYFSYQWKKNGVPITGETKETLAIPSLARAHSGLYTVTVTGVAGARTSAALSVTVSANSVQPDPLYKVSFVNTSDIFYLTSPSISQGGSLAAGTKVTLTGFGSGKMLVGGTSLLGWNIFDATGNVTKVQARGGNFIMPASPVTISANKGRTPAGSYSGFLSVERPWSDQEWSGDQAGSLKLSSSKVKGFFKCTISSLGGVSGTVLLEGKSLPFASSLAWTEAGEWYAPFQLRTSYQGNVWTLSGKLVLNSGLIVPATTDGTGNPKLLKITVEPSKYDLVNPAYYENKSVVGYGIASGTTIISAEVAADNRTVSLTLSEAVTATSPKITLIIGAEDAQKDNVAHVTMNGAIFEKILPKVTNSQTLYSVAACNQSAYKVLQTFIAEDDPARTIPATLRYTTAVHRYDRSLEAGLHCLGRGGVLSTAISNQGMATVLGWLPSGAGGTKITYSGYVGRPFFRSADLDTDQGVPTFPNASETLGRVADQTGAGDRTGVVVPVSEIESAGSEVMRETMLRRTASVSLPIWSTAPPGDTSGEPLFGALLFSGLRADGCLGVLSPKIDPDHPLDPARDSEYTHNYADGWIYDSTVVLPSVVANPFTITADSRLLTISPEEIASKQVGTYPNAFVSLDSASDGAYLAGGNLGTVSFKMNALLGGSSALTGGTGFSVTPPPDNNTGLFTAVFVENTGRYVGGIFSTVSAAENLNNDWCQGRLQLSTRIYGIILQGDRLPVDSDRTKRKNIGEYAPGIAGFLTRGSLTTGNKLIDVLGNKPQRAVTKDGGGGITYKTYRTEAISIIPYEPY